MKLLTRYVLREFCVPLFYCLTGFLSIYLLFELFGSFSRLQAANPGLGKCFVYLTGYLAPYFKWMAPACLMLATLYTMWNFCRHSEITAMRASGIGFFTIVKPLLAVAALMAAAVAAVDEFYVPRTGQWVQQFRKVKFDESKMQKEDDIVYPNVKAHRTWHVGAVIARDATALEDVAVYVNDPRGGRRMTIKSPRVENLDGIWYFSKPEIAYFDETGAETVSPTPDLDRLTLRPFPQFTETPAELLAQNRDWEFCSTREHFDYLATHPALWQADRRELTYKLWAQIAAPLACLVITLFAIPAGIASGRQSVFKGIVLALVMFFAFYGVTILCMTCASFGWCPPVVAAFLPDVLFLGVGCWLFRRQR